MAAVPSISDEGEIRRLNSDVDRLETETRKLIAERLKLAAERSKLEGDVRAIPFAVVFNGLIATAALLGAGAVVAMLFFP